MFLLLRLFLTLQGYFLKITSTYLLGKRDKKEEEVKTWRGDPHGKQTPLTSVLPPPPNSMSPKAIPDKATLPDFSFFSRLGRPHVPHFPFVWLHFFLGGGGLVSCVLPHARGWSACSAYSLDWTCHRKLRWPALSGMGLGATHCFHFSYYIKSLGNSQKFPQMSSPKIAFGGSPKMVSKGPSSRGFALRYVLPPPWALTSKWGKLKERNRTTLQLSQTFAEVCWFFDRRWKSKGFPKDPTVLKTLRRHKR